MSHYDFNCRPQYNKRTVKCNHVGNYSIWYFTSKNICCVIANSVAMKRVLNNQSIAHYTHASPPCRQVVSLWCSLPKWVSGKHLLKCQWISKMCQSYFPQSSMSKAISHMWTQSQKKNHWINDVVTGLYFIYTFLKPMLSFCGRLAKRNGLRKTRMILKNNANTT